MASLLVCSCTSQVLVADGCHVSHFSSSRDSRLHETKVGLNWRAAISWGCEKPVARPVQRNLQKCHESSFHQQLFCQATLTRTVSVTLDNCATNHGQYMRPSFQNPSVVSNQSRATLARGGRSVHFESDDTFLFLEPGEDEIFLSEAELRDKLKTRLEQWPKELPDDLRRFSELDDAITYLIGSACELDLGGGEGNLQWFEVRLE